MRTVMRRGYATASSVKVGQGRLRKHSGGKTGQAAGKVMNSGMEAEGEELVVRGSNRSLS